jgi:hypothetical protein
METVAPHKEVGEGHFRNNWQVTTKKISEYFVILYF